MVRSEVSLESVQDFLSKKRIALVGVSREKHHISMALLEEFERKGFEVFAVNPNISEVKGRRCFARVQDIQPAPETALLFTPPHITNDVVRDCYEAGVLRVWMYAGGSKGAVSPEAIEFCRKRGIEVIPGECPFMFLDPVHGVHRFHRFCSRLFGSYPHAKAKSA